MRNSTTVLTSLVITTVCFGSSLVLARAATPPATAAQKPAAQAAAALDTSFQALDKHHHGYLVRSDVPHSMGNLRAHFIEFDTNHDGRLSPPEYAQYERGFPENMGTEQLRKAIGTSFERSLRAPSNAAPDSAGVPVDPENPVH